MDELVERLGRLEHRIDEAESRLAIFELKARYGDAVDRRFHRGNLAEPAVVTAAATEASLMFTPDGVWDGGPALGRSVGRDAIAERLARPTLRFSRHLFVKPRLTIDGDTAMGRWDLLVPCLDHDGGATWMAGYEDDTYRRIDGVWLHATMQLTTFFVAPVTEGWGRIFA